MSTTPKHSTSGAAGTMPGPTLTVPEATRQAIARLVERFSTSIEAYQNAAYNETQTRNEFINPFFKALGWDVDHEQNIAPAYQDVIHEDSIKVGGFTKAPDYSFRVGGQRKFFVEAKKPSVDMKNDPEPYYQVRRYAYSAKLPLSIITDFEELALVDCRVKPSPKDKPSAGRIRYWRFDEYLDNIEEIYNIFSREAVWSGSFDRFAAASKTRRGTGEVDKEFLKEIESWRDLLARNIALRNSGLSQRELNEAVQVTIDRIIFLRICEDRGIEEYGVLQGMQNGTNVYPRLCQLFQQADERYNSGLFHFREERGRPGHPDDLTLNLAIDDKTLKQILKGLYYPDSPYEFSVLPADILGQVYEQFLGKVIRLTAGHQAKVEDKPEVKKAGGVYYTPTYVVDYIVKNTVGKLLEGATPKKAAKLRILDPACGSGSFLIGAYEHLLDWHRDWYSANEAEKWATGKEPRLFAGKNGWQLTTAEKKRILLNNIYGVDIDPQAVEVTKLSLLLKVLEEESQETINSQLKFFHERALPDLGNNIKCGNSLIGSDFYEGQQLGLLDEEEIQRVNPFNWEDEFSEIMKAGGFDSVIGNPPYIRMEAFKSIKKYLKSHYEVHGARSDIYAYFIEKAHRILSQNGSFGMIVSNKFIKANYGTPLREFLQNNSQIEIIVDLAGLKVFSGATIRPIVLITENVAVNPTQQKEILYLDPPDAGTFQRIAGGSLSLTEIVERDGIVLPKNSLMPSNWLLIGAAEQFLLEKLETNCLPLRDLVDDQVLWGIKTGLNKAFVINEETKLQLLKSDPICAEVIKPFLFGEDVRRYSINFGHRYLLYMHHGIDISKYQAVHDYLLPYRKALEQRATKQEWYELQQPSTALAPIIERPKVVYPEIAPECRFTLDSDAYYPNNKTFVLPSADLYLLGLLNSKVALFYFSIMCAALESASMRFLEFRAQYVRSFPVHRLDLSKAKDKSRHDQMVELVERMLDLNKRLQEAQAAHEKDSLQRQIDATDRQIDRLVYELYDLTDDEIKIVETQFSSALV